MKYLGIFLICVVSFCNCEQARYPSTHGRGKKEMPRPKVQPQGSLNLHIDVNKDVSSPYLRNKEIPKQFQPITDIRKTAKLLPILPVLTKINPHSSTIQFPANGKIVTTPTNNQIPINSHQDKVKTSFKPKSRKQNDSSIPNTVPNTQERKTYIISKLPNNKLKPEDNRQSEVKKVKEAEPDVLDNVVKPLTPDKSLLNDKNESPPAVVNNKVIDYNLTNPKLNDTKLNRSDDVFKLLINPLVKNFIQDTSDLEVTSGNNDKIDNTKIMGKNHSENTKNVHKAEKNVCKPDHNVNTKYNKFVNNVATVKTENFQDSSVSEIYEPIARVIENYKQPIMSYRNLYDGFSLKNMPIVEYYRPYIILNKGYDENQYNPVTYNEPPDEHRSTNNVNNKKSRNEEDANSMTLKIWSNTKLVIQKVINDQTDTGVDVKRTDEGQSATPEDYYYQQQTPLNNNNYNDVAKYYTRNYQNQGQQQPWYDYNF